MIDAGAVKALRGGGSLLPVGVSAIAGEFERGDTVRVLGPAGEELARGICNYGASDLARIAGRRLDDIEAVLGLPLRRRVHPPRRSGAAVSFAPDRTRGPIDPIAGFHAVEHGLGFRDRGGRLAEGRAAAEGFAVRRRACVTPTTRPTLCRARKPAPA